MQFKVLIRETPICFQKKKKNHGPSPLPLVTIFLKTPHMLGCRAQRNKQRTREINLISANLNFHGVNSAMLAEKKTSVIIPSSRPPCQNTEMPGMMPLLLLLWHDCYLVNNLFLTRSKVCSTKGHLMTWSSPRPGAVIGSRI